jgi:hypothetical protein
MNTISGSKLTLIASDGSGNLLYRIKDNITEFILHESFSYIFEVDNYYLIPTTIINDHLPLQSQMPEVFWKHLTVIKGQPSVKRIRVED